MTFDRSKSTLDELQGLLEVYGADKERWPSAARARAETTLSGNRQAARLLAEATALDAVLAHAPLPRPDRRAALAERILVEAHRTAPQDTAKQPGIVIPWPGAARRSSAPAPAVTTQSSWRAAAVLAASLALGIFIGALDLAPAPVNQLVEAVELDDPDQMAALISNDGLAAALDEDFL